MSLEIRIIIAYALFKILNALKNIINVVRLIVAKQLVLLTLINLKV